MRCFFDLRRIMFNGFAGHFVFLRAGFNLFYLIAAVPYLFFNFLHVNAAQLIMMSRVHFLLPFNLPYSIVHSLQPQCFRPALTISTAEFSSTDCRDYPLTPSTKFCDRWPLACAASYAVSLTF